MLARILHPELVGPPLKVDAVFRWTRGGGFEPYI
jgi:hypothetical protein